MKTKFHDIYYSFIKESESNYNSYVSDEGDKLNVLIYKLLKDYVKDALKNPKVVEHFFGREGWSPNDEDAKHQVISDILFDIGKNSNIKISSSDMNRITSEIIKDDRDEADYQHEQDEAERYERFRDSYS